MFALVARSVNCHPAAEEETCANFDRDRGRWADEY